MKKLIPAVILTLFFVLLISPVTLAAEKEYIIDQAQILSYEEWFTLNERAMNISEEHSCDVAVITVYEMPVRDAYAAAEHYYAEFNFGYSEPYKSGLLLFLSMEDRDYALISYAHGNTVFTDYGKDVMLDDHILPLLAEDDYYAAFSTYLDKAEEFLVYADEGKPFDNYTAYNSEAFEMSADTSLLIRLAVVILLPLLIAGVICLSWKSQMKTAVAARAADNYIPQDGFILTKQEDSFIYRTQRRRTINQNTSGSSGGGTTVRSGGSSGRSGKF